jgi:hypothetical protein
MKTQTKDPLSKPRLWIALYGLPALIATGWMVGLALLAHLFFSPMPLDAAISKDLQTPGGGTEQGDSPDPAPPGQLSF